MKKIIMLLLLATAINAHAIVADTFSCHLEITGSENGESARQSFEFSAPRLPYQQLLSTPTPSEPLPPLPPPDQQDPNVLKTEAHTNVRLSMGNAEGTIIANVGLSYQHAVKLDSSAQIVDARQHTCFWLSANYCKKSTIVTSIDPISPVEPIISCTQGIKACFVLDPFNPVHGWPVVGHSDGVPDFNSTELNPIEQIVTEDINGESRIRGTVRVACQYTGTYK